MVWSVAGVGLSTALFAAYLSFRAEVVPALRTPELCLDPLWVRIEVVRIVVD